MQTDISVGLPLIAKAREKRQEDRLFQQWVVQLPLMALTGEITSFADYKSRATGANIDLRPTAEILAELDEVEKKLQEGGAQDVS